MNKSASQQLLASVTQLSELTVVAHAFKDTNKSRMTQIETQRRAERKMVANGLKGRCVSVQLPSDAVGVRVRQSVVKAVNYHLIIFYIPF